MSTTNPPNHGAESSTIALGEHLTAHNGTVGIEVLEPSVERAVRLTRP